MYTEKRYNNNLVAGFLHDEKSNNIHYHLMISSNEVGEYKNQRLTKFEFEKVKQETEKYVLDKYPELEQGLIINAKKNPDKTKQSNKAGELKRKGGRLEKKDKITRTLKNIFSKSQSKEDFFNRLSKQNIKLYNRGNTIGFINGSDNKKYRLKTLALESEFQKVSDLMGQTQRKNQKTTNKEKDKGRGEQKEQSKQQQYENKSEFTPADAKQTEIEKRKAEIKKMKAARSDQKGKNKGKNYDFER